ncbi:hypothetical protein [Streptomyces sp. HNM0574]|uniref:hypothetical protein n=1 Tax=Streptomyces sp. HNM0574 TaxID=2714954 RepID=UPI00146C2B7D|nr:hypothetical protein [Streptomyces sp. HNM0574]NLU69679.1 hypothetical protein [Streptomyces sp. HNM0574]
MTQQPHDGTPGGSRPDPAGTRPQRGGPARMLLCFAGVLALAVVAAVLLVVTGAAELQTALVVVAWVMVLLSFGLSRWLTHQRKQRYLTLFPTLDDVRRGLDEDALRTVRDRDGVPQAVRELRRQVPGMPLTDAAKLVREL